MFSLNKVLFWAVYFLTNQYDCDHDKYQKLHFCFRCLKGNHPVNHYFPVDVNVHFNWCKALYSLCDGLENATRNQNLVKQNQWEMLTAVFTVEKDSLSCHNLISDNVKQPHNYHSVRRINCLIIMDEYKKTDDVRIFSVASDGLLRIVQSCIHSVLMLDECGF